MSRISSFAIGISRTCRNILSNKSFKLDYSATRILVSNVSDQVRNFSNQVRFDQRNYEPVRNHLRTGLAVFLSLPKAGKVNNVGDPVREISKHVGTNNLIQDSEIAIQV